MIIHRLLLLCHLFISVRIEMLVQYHYSSIANTNAILYRTPEYVARRVAQCATLRVWEFAKWRSRRTHPANAVARAQRISFPQTHFQLLHPESALRFGATRCQCGALVFTEAQRSRRGTIVGVCTSTYICTLVYGVLLVSFETESCSVLWNAHVVDPGG